MKYLSREIRNEIASVLITEHNGWVRYRDKQPPHPSRGIHIKRGIAESKIRRMRELLSIVAPKKHEANQHTRRMKVRNTSNATKQNRAPEHARHSVQRMSRLRKRLLAAERRYEKRVQALVDAKQCESYAWRQVEEARKLLAAAEQPASQTHGQNPRNPRSET